MKRIPVVVVDDQVDDRYIVKRVLSKYDEFDEVLEVSSGDVFLRDHFKNEVLGELISRPLLVLMDINMPRMNGFETIEEMQRHMEDGRAPNSIVVMMFTSSENPRDKARAEELDAVKGYVSKPLDAEGVESILSLYQSL